MYLEFPYELTDNCSTRQPFKQPDSLVPIYQNITQGSMDMEWNDGLTFTAASPFKKTTRLVIRQPEIELLVLFRTLPACKSYICSVGQLILPTRRSRLLYPRTNRGRKRPRNCYRPKTEIHHSYRKTNKKSKLFARFNMANIYVSR